MGNSLPTILESGSDLNQNQPSKSNFHEADLLPQMRSTSSSDSSCDVVANQVLLDNDLKSPERSVVRSGRHNSQAHEIEDPKKEDVEGICRNIKRRDPAHLDEPDLILNNAGGRDMSTGKITEMKSPRQDEGRPGRPFSRKGSSAGGLACSEAEDEQEAGDKTLSLASSRMLRQLGNNQCAPGGETKGQELVVGDGLLESDDHEQFEDDEGLGLADKPLPPDEHHEQVVVPAAAQDEQQIFHKTTTSAEKKKKKKDHRKKKKRQVRERQRAKILNLDVPGMGVDVTKDPPQLAFLPDVDLAGSDCDGFDTAIFGPDAAGKIQDLFKVQKLGLKRSEVLKQEFTTKEEETARAKRVEENKKRMMFLKNKAASARNKRRAKKEEAKHRSRHHAQRSHNVPDEQTATAKKLPSAVSTTSTKITKKKRRKQDLVSKNPLKISGAKHRDKLLTERGRIMCEKFGISQFVRPFKAKTANKFQALMLRKFRTELNVDHVVARNKDRREKEIKADAGGESQEQQEKKRLQLQEEQEVFGDLMDVCDDGPDAVSDVGACMSRDKFLGLASAPSTASSSCQVYLPAQDVDVNMDEVVVPHERRENEDYIRATSTAAPASACSSAYPLPPGSCDREGEDHENGEPRLPSDHATFFGKNETHGHDFPACSKKGTRKFSNGTFQLFHKKTKTVFKILPPVGKFDAKEQFHTFQGVFNLPTENDHLESEKKSWPPEGLRKKVFVETVEEEPELESEGDNKPENINNHVGGDKIKKANKKKTSKRTEDVDKKGQQEATQLNVDESERAKRRLRRKEVREQANTNGQGQGFSKRGPAAVPPKQQQEPSCTQQQTAALEQPSTQLQQPWQQQPALEQPTQHQPPQQQPSQDHSSEQQQPSTSRQADGPPAAAAKAVASQPSENKSCREEVEVNFYHDERRNEKVQVADRDVDVSGNGEGRQPQLVVVPPASMPSSSTKLTKMLPPALPPMKIKAAVKASAALHAPAASQGQPAQRRGQEQLQKSTQQEVASGAAISATTRIVVAPSTPRGTGENPATLQDIKFKTPTRSDELVVLSSRNSQNHTRSSRSCPRSSVEIPKPEMKLQTKGLYCKDGILYQWIQAKSPNGDSQEEEQKAKPKPEERNINPNDYFRPTAKEQEPLALASGRTTKQRQRVVVVRTTTSAPLQNHGSRSSSKSKQIHTKKKRDVRDFFPL